MSEYSEWLAKQPAKVQNDILGKRADAYRAGEFKPDKFDGAIPLTLEQFAGKSDLINMKGEDDGA